VLVVMRQVLSPQQADFLSDLGVHDPVERVALLDVGEALVVHRS
jgi:hypothetical protein